MTTADYLSLTPREKSPSGSSRLLSFYKNGSTRFFPGDGTRLRFANRDTDTLDIPAVPSGFLAKGDYVTVEYKGTCVFRGDVATIRESQSRGTDRVQSVVCEGPWAKMARLVYRQYWFTGNGADLSSRLILNETQSGASQNLNAELREIAQHGASACGYQVGTISVSTQTLPSDECRDITVAEAVRRELRLFPKAVAYFDYSTDTPTFNIVRNADSAATASYVADIPKTAREYTYNAHPITGVDLEIEASGDVDGVTYRNIGHQKAGDATAGNPDCLYATLQIKGASSSATYQTFKSVTEDIPADLNSVDWWKQKHPRLANVATSQITITNATRTPSTYERISAATAGELEAAGLKCEVSQFTCSCSIDTAEDKEEGILLTLNFLTTNAKTKTYRWCSDSSAESGETVPAGLARAILDERIGSLVSESLSIRLGDAFPKIGDAIAESEGTVFLQSFDVDCGGLVADLSFGTPEYLSPEDMASLLSNFRNKRTTSSSSMRKTGQSVGKDDVELGSIPPLSSSEFSPGKVAKATIAASDGGGSITLDPSALDDGESIAVQTITVKGDDGEDKEVKILASEEFAPGGVGVTSLNDATGDLDVIGGKGIEVSTDGQTIKVTWNKDKEDEDEDPNDDDGDEPSNPCDHDSEGGSEGGVEAGGGGGIGGGGGGTGDDEGGVPAGGGESHTGDDNCNCG